MTLKTYGVADEQTFAYDSLRRMILDPDNNEGNQLVICEYNYDALHRQLSSTQTIGSGPAQSLSKVFDDYGHEVECHHPSGRVVRFDYTARHQVDAIYTSSANGGVQVTDYTYEYEDSDSDKRMVLTGQSKSVKRPLSAKSNLTSVYGHLWVPIERSVAKKLSSTPSMSGQGLTGGAAPSTSESKP